MTAILLPEGILLQAHAFVPACQDSRLPSGQPTPAHPAPPCPATPVLGPKLTSAMALSRGGPPEAPGQRSGEGQGHALGVPPSAASILWLLPWIQGQLNGHS